MQDRELKIQETADSYLLRTGKRNSAPFIKLLGNWLHLAGFIAGDRVEVIVKFGELVIRPVKE